MELEVDHEQLIIGDKSPDPDRSHRLKRLKKGITARGDSSMGSLPRDDDDFNIPIDSSESPEFTKSDNEMVGSDPSTGSLERGKESEEFEISKMDLEDDSEQLIIHDEFPDPDRSPRLKRLKKGIHPPRASSMGSLFRDDELFNIPVDSPKSPESAKSEDGLAGSDQKSASLERDKDSEEFDRLFPWEGEEKVRAKRALIFGDDDDDTGDKLNGIEESEKGEGGESDHNWDGFWEEKEKRKRDEEGDAEIHEGRQKKKERKEKRKKGGSADETNEGMQKKKERKKGDKIRSADSEAKISKRKEQEDKAQFANFQRELRERKDVGFKPVSVAPKPISSVLEKIRQRKLNLAKKASSSSGKEYSGPLREIGLNVDSENVPIIEREDSKEGGLVLKELNTQQTAKEDFPSAPPIDGSPQPSSGQKTNVRSMEDNEDNQQAFRAPADDTQDLFPESQARNSQYDNIDKEMGSPCDENLAPTLPSMNLKLDSAPADDMSDDDDDDEDEEYGDKENTKPSFKPALDTDSPPKGDRMKEFLDEEASEEDDSDNDKMRFGDDEGDDDDDAEDLADMIATNYTEKPIDDEMRNELHQKWLEQQDEARTENLLLRLNQKYSFNEREIASLDFDVDEETKAGGEADEKEDGEEEDEAEEVSTANFARFSTKHLRQMIPQMFSDKDEGGYVSSEDEETEKRLVKQQLLGKMSLEEKTTFVAPAEDETTREPFGRVKKLNMVHETKKKTKITSFFEVNLTKGKVFNSSTKSSFLHRASSIPVSRKSGSGVTRGFIFGRDDSNSRSSMLPEEDTSDVIDTSQKNSKSRRTTFGTRYGGSQARLGSQYSSLETSRSSLSLFDVLSRSSAHSRDSFSQDETIDQQAVFAAMKATAMRSINVEATT